VHNWAIFLVKQNLWQWNWPPFESHATEPWRSRYFWLG